MILAANYCLLGMDFICQILVKFQLNRSNLYYVHQSKWARKFNLVKEIMNYSAFFNHGNHSRSLGCAWSPYQVSVSSVVCLRFSKCSSLIDKQPWCILICNHHIGLLAIFCFKLHLMGINRIVSCTKMVHVICSLLIILYLIIPHCFYTLNL